MTAWRMITHIDQLKELINFPTVHVEREVSSSCCGLLYRHHLQPHRRHTTQGWGRKVPTSPARIKG